MHFEHLAKTKDHSDISDWWLIVVVRLYWSSFGPANAFARTALQSTGLDNWQKNFPFFPAEQASICSILFGGLSSAAPLSPSSPQRLSSSIRPPFATLCLLVYRDTCVCVAFSPSRSLYATASSGPSTRASIKVNFGRLSSITFRLISSENSLESSKRRNSESALLRFVCSS